MQPWLAWSREAPGGVICHPIAVFAVAALALNDHLLKQVSPGPLTGKLSDVAGLVFFPLLVVAATELFAMAIGRARPTRTPVLWAAISVTAAIYVAIKVWPAATDVYNAALGTGQWLLAAGPLTNRPLLATTGVTDPTDLLALPALMIAWLVGCEPRVASSAVPRRSAVSLVVLVVAGLASMATSPAMRSSSTSYEEEIQLTRAAPAVARHLAVEITNRDPQLSSIDMLARSYTKGVRTELDTPGLSVSLLADPSEDHLVMPSSQYSGPALSYFEACSSSCRRGATVLVRLTDPDAYADDAVVKTNLAVGLYASASEVGTGPVDTDLALTNEADLAFHGTPAIATQRQAGSLHVGADESGYESSFEISIYSAALQEPYGFPLIGELVVGIEHETAVGHPFAHNTWFEFNSAALPPDAYAYTYVAVNGGWEDDQPEPPTVLDLTPLCTPGEDCRIEVTLISQYDPMLNEPQEPGDEPTAGSIDLDWFLEVRLEAYDGRSLPEGAISIETAD